MIHRNSACFGGNISPFCEQNDIATHTLVTESHNSQESRPFHEQYQANFLKIAPARLTSATHKNIMPVLASKTKQAFPTLEREA
jgi:hypothetical protein